MNDAHHPSLLLQVFTDHFKAELKKKLLAAVMPDIDAAVEQAALDLNTYVEQEYEYAGKKMTTHVLVHRKEVK